MQVMHLESLTLTSATGLGDPLLESVSMSGEIEP